MTTLYLMPDGDRLFSPDRRLPPEIVNVIRDGLRDSVRTRGIIVMGEPVEVVDLRDSLPVVVDAATRLRDLGFPDYDYLP